MKILDVSNLRISFRTVNGKVQAVRGVDFYLNEGETLAIVGESGSGKSVTARAILGISAGNAITESGEMLYDGQDLLKISEEDFHKIRGDQIAMIFQDPLSALNPIVRIGKQLTEAMIIKSRSASKRSRRTFKSTLTRLNRFTDFATNADSNPQIKEANALRCKNFAAFEQKHVELEYAFNTAKESISEAVYLIVNLSLEISKHVAGNIAKRSENICRHALRAVSPFVVNAEVGALNYNCTGLLNLIALAKKNGSAMDYTGIIEYFNVIKEILLRADALPVPDFFAMGYYLTFCPDALPALPVPELNVFLNEYINKFFMLEFSENTEHALRYSFGVSLENKKIIIEELKAAEARISASGALIKAEMKELEKNLSGLVEQSIDKFRLKKDSPAYTFESSLLSEINSYFDGIKHNVKEQNRFDKESRKFAALKEKGKNPDWKPIPAGLADLNLIKENIIILFARLREDYEQNLADAPNHDFKAQTLEVIDFLRETALAVARVETPSSAKIKALKIMEEVGIPEPAKRYRQYPFQFSGGMRQRIVIAIALTANPRILICDEPTTALDVTIQAQILELINRLKERHGLSIIFITHDLGVVANMADRIAVMYAGKIVEYGTSEEVFYSPAHPYTWALLSSMPDLETKEKLDAIPGTPPNMLNPPKGDAFAVRNKYALKIDFEEEPPLFRITDTHYAATWLLHPHAPKVEPPKIVTERIERSKKRFEEKKAKSAPKEEVSQ